MRTFAELQRFNMKLAGAFMLAFLFCASLLAVRTAWRGTIEYWFLLWNLFLAILPLGFSSVICFTKGTGWRICFGIFWFIFFPNAPYLITDLEHLKTSYGPIWLDVLLLSSFAATGLALAFVSLQQLHLLFIRANKRISGWLFVVATCFFTGFGIYLGRVQRWKSSDFITNPASLLADAIERFLHPLSHPRTWGITLGLATFVLIGYLFLYFSGGKLELVNASKKI